LCPQHEWDAQNRAIEEAQINKEKLEQLTLEQETLKQENARIQREKEEREEELKELKARMDSEAETAAQIEAAVGPLIAGEQGKDVITVINLGALVDVPSAGTYVPNESETLSSSLGGLITEVF